MGLFSRVDRFFGKALMRTFGTVFLAGGLLASYYGTEQVLTAWEARSWPTVQGEVVASSLIGDGRPEVVYQYTVSGKSYENRKVHVGQYTGISSYAREIVASYPQGTAVEVFYDPNDPEVAVLEHRLPWTSFLLAAIGAGFLYGAYLCFRSRKGLVEILATADID